MARYTRTVKPADTLISLTEAKRYAVWGDDADDDLMIASILEAAESSIEGQLNRALQQQTWQVVLDGFPADGCIRLDRPPVQSVTSVECLVDTVWTAVPATSYTVAVGGEEPGLIEPTSSWPTPDTGRSTVRVTFVAGYTADSLPDTYRAAVQQEVVGMLEQRSPEVVGSIVTEHPRFKRLLQNPNMTGGFF